MSAKTLERIIFRVLLFAGFLVLIITNWSFVTRTLGYLQAAAHPVILGCGLAYVVNMLVKPYERWLWPKHQKGWQNGLRRFTSIILSYLTITLVLALVISLVVPQAVNAIVAFASAVPRLIQQGETWLMTFSDRLPTGMDIVKRLNIDLADVTRQAAARLTSWTQVAMGSILSFVATSTSTFFNWLLAWMISLYILASKERLGRQFRQLVKTYTQKKTANVIFNLLGIVHHAFAHYFSGQVIEAIILGCLITVGMWILRLPYAGMLGALTGVSAFVPFVGAYIAAAVGALLLLVNSPMQMVIYLIFVVIIQQIESNAIYPFVVGNSIGLPGLFVLVAITVGGGMAGILGMILGVPIASAAYRLIKFDYWYRLDHDVSGVTLKPLASLRDPDLLNYFEKE